MAAIPAGAGALYNLLSALFTFIDEQVEPRNLRVITAEKMRWVAERVGMQAEFGDSFSLAPEVLADSYHDLECQYYIIPSKLRAGGADAEHAYGFDEPDAPGLTKAGFVKLQALELILETEIGNKHYRFLQNCITTFPLQRIDPTTGIKLTFPPLPPQQVVTYYVTTLATSLLGITDPTATGIHARVAARRQQSRQEPPPAAVSNVYVPAASYVMS